MYWSTFGKKIQFSFFFLKISLIECFLYFCRQYLWHLLPISEWKLSTPSFFSEYTKYYFSVSTSKRYMFLHYLHFLWNYLWNLKAIYEWKCCQLNYLWNIKLSSNKIGGFTLIFTQKLLENFTIKHKLISSKKSEMIFSCKTYINSDFFL